MAAIRPSHSVDSNQSYPSMSHSMEFPRAYATLNQKRHSIRHSTSILEDVVSIEHVICLSSDEHESVQKYYSTSYFSFYKNFAYRVFWDINVCTLTKLACYIKIHTIQKKQIITSDYIDKIQIITLHYIAKMQIIKS